MEHAYAIEGMHCESCVSKIDEALRSIPGVVSSRVTLNPPRATVTMERHVPLVDLQKVVRRAGDYTIKAADEGTATTATDALAEPGAAKESLYPLALIVGYLLGMVLLFAWVHRDFSPPFLMTHFMGGFFVVFSFFKLLDLRGFKDAYRSYDVVARAVPAWGFVYPFVELVLGVAYLAELSRIAISTATLVIMGIGSVGVFQTLRQKRTIRCACLGTVLNLPMTKVTLVEDVGMAAMALVMLILRH